MLCYEQFCSQENSHIYKYLLRQTEQYATTTGRSKVIETVLGDSSAKSAMHDTLVDKYPAMRALAQAEVGSIRLS